MALHIGSVIEAKFASFWQGQVALNIRHYVCTALSGTGPTDLEIANAIDDLFRAPYTAALSASVSFYGVYARQIDIGNVTDPVLSTTGRQSGALGGDGLPRQVSGLISLRTGSAGRSRRGRFYMPWPAESQNNAEGFPVAGYVTLLEAVATKLRTQLVAGPVGNVAAFDPVVNSRKLGLQLLITRTIVRSVWATQRKRSDFGRTNPVPS